MRAVVGEPVDLADYAVVLGDRGRRVSRDFTRREWGKDALTHALRYADKLRRAFPGVAVTVFGRCEEAK